MGQTAIKSGTPEWLEWRRKRITATDWPALVIPDDKRPDWMGTPLSVWERITGRAPVEDVSDKPWLEWGLWAEHMALPWYVELTGRKVLRNTSLWTADVGPGRGDVDDAWMGCTLDGLMALPGQMGVWECKAPGYRGLAAWEQDDGTLEVPLYYQIQVQAQLYMTGHKIGAVSCVSWPHHYHGDVDFNPTFCARAVERIEKFWHENVQKDIPPAPTAADADRKVLARLHEPTVPTVTMTPEVVELCLNIEALEADIKAMDYKAKQLRNDLRAWMQERNALRCVDPGAAMAWQFNDRGLRRVKP